MHYQQMSQKIIKGRSSHQGAFDTWSPGEGEGQNFYMPSKQHMKQIVNQPQNQSQHEQFKPKSQHNLLAKPPKHRRKQSQNQRTQKLESLQQFQYYPPPVYVTPQVTPKTRLSAEKRSNIVEASKEIEQRFQEIQAIMGVENENLREQKDYLLKTIYKMQMREKEYKNQILHYKNKALELEMENKILREKYSKARQFISNGIDKMQEAISKDTSQNNSNKNTGCKSNESSINVSQQIEELNDKFDALMYQYQKTRQPELRKRCMQIAKELKKLRKIEEQNNFHLPHSMIKKQNSKNE